MKYMNGTFGLYAPYNQSSYMFRDIIIHGLPDAFRCPWQSRLLLSFLLFKSGPLVPTFRKIALHAVVV